MYWIITLAGMALAGVVCYGMGVRNERGKHARWATIQEAERGIRRSQGGVRLRRLRISR